MKNAVLMLFAFLFLSSNTYIPDESKGKLPDTIELKIEPTIENNVSSNFILHQNLIQQNANFPSIEVFEEAMKGFEFLKHKNAIQKEILTIVDFSQSSKEKRMWVIDVENQTILFNTHVAHGRNSGEEFADKFSNKAESFQSSLGFYATAEVYQGKHGYSLRLDGMEKGLNDLVRKRAVVIHGADYVHENFIKKNNRLGRSLGCPAIPEALSREIINVIKDKSCLFIYHPSQYKSTLVPVV